MWKHGNMEGEPGAWEPSTTSSTNKKSFRILIGICTQRCQPLVSLACPRSKHVPLLQDLFREIGPTAVSSMLKLQTSTELVSLKNSLVTRKSTYLQIKSNTSLCLLTRSSRVSTSKQFENVCSFRYQSATSV